MATVGWTEGFIDGSVNRHNRRSRTRHEGFTPSRYACVRVVSIPALAHNDDAGDRYYRFGDELFYSITTIIGGGVPKYLGPWYAKMAAELVYEDVVTRGPAARAQALIRRWARAGRADFLERQARGELKSLKLAKQSEQDLALRWLKGAAERSRDISAARGTEVHEKAEDLALAHAVADTRLTLEGKTPEPWPEALAGYERSFHQWIEDWRPVVIATEATVINRTQSYAGTLDLIGTFSVADLIDSILRIGKVVPLELARFHRASTVNVCVDYKSGNHVYAEVALQVAAQARAEFMAHPLGRIELPMPPVDLGAVLHLTPTGYDFRLLRIDDAVFDMFKFAREVFRFRKEMAGTVFLADLKPVAAAVA